MKQFLGFFLISFMFGSGLVLKMHSEAYTPLTPRYCSSINTATKTCDSPTVTRKIHFKFLFQKICASVVMVMLSYHSHIFYFLLLALRLFVPFYPLISWWHYHLPHHCYLFNHYAPTLSISLPHAIMLSNTAVLTTTAWFLCPFSCCAGETDISLLLKLGLLVTSHRDIMKLCLQIFKEEHWSLVSSTRA